MLRKAESGLVAALGETHADVAQARIALAECLLARGERKSGLELAEKVVAQLEKSSQSKELLREARALVEKR